MPLWRSVEVLESALLPVLVILNWAPVTGSADQGCGSFRHLENGRTFFRYGGLYVAFSCNPGFKIHGHRTSSCVSGQWAREPPLCVAAGCASPGELQHGTAAVAPGGSLVRFTCDRGFRLYGSSLLYCKGQVWNGSLPVCKESDIMSSYQLKETPSSHSRLELSQDDLANPKTSLIRPAVPPSESNLATNLQKLPDRPKNVPTQGTGKSVGLKETSTGPDIPREPITKQHLVQTRFGDTLDLPLLTPSPTVSASTLVPTLLLLKPNTTILVTTTKEKQQKESPIRSSCIVEAQTGNQMISTDAVTSREAKLTTASTQIDDLGDAPTWSLKIKSGLYESLTIPLETSIDGLVMSPTVEGTGSKNALLSSNPFVGRSPSIPAVAPYGGSSFWDSSPSGHGEDLMAKMKLQRSFPDLHSMTSSDNLDLNSDTKTRVNEDPGEAYKPLEGHRMVKELKDVSRLGTIGPARSSLVTPKVGSLATGGHGQGNATANQSAVKHRLDTTSRTRLIFSTSEIFQRPVCPYPPVPTHGTFYFRTVAKPEPLQNEQYVQYSCYAGYTLANGDVYSYCLQDGRWSGATPTCIDVNECLLPAGRARCVFGCVNTPGSFHCRCPAGYAVNTSHGLCTDVDECVENEGLGLCAHTCLNTPGSFRCACPLGYQLAGDGRTCVSECPPGFHVSTSHALAGNWSTGPCLDVDECKQGDRDRCEWKCVNLPGTHRCICPRGYTPHPDGHRCRDIDECLLGNGGCSHVCVNRRGGNKCACPKNYRVSPYNRRKCQPVQD